MPATAGAFTHPSPFPSSRLPSHHQPGPVLRLIAFAARKKCRDRRMNPPSMHPRPTPDRLSPPPTPVARTGRHTPGLLGQERAPDPCQPPLPVQADAAEHNLHPAKKDLGARIGQILGPDLPQVRREPKPPPPPLPVTHRTTGFDDTPQSTHTRLRHHLQPRWPYPQATPYEAGGHT